MAALLLALTAVIPGDVEVGLSLFKMLAKGLELLAAIVGVVVAGLSESICKWVIIAFSRSRSIFS